MKLRAPVGWTIAIAHVMSNVVNFTPAELCSLTDFIEPRYSEKYGKRKKCSTFINFFFHIYAMIRLYLQVLGTVKHYKLCIYFFFELQAEQDIPSFYIQLVDQLLLFKAFKRINKYHEREKGQSIFFKKYCMHFISCISAIVGVKDRYGSQLTGVGNFSIINRSSINYLSPPFATNGSFHRGELPLHSGEGHRKVLEISQPHFRRMSTRNANKKSSTKMFRLALDSLLLARHS